MCTLYLLWILYVLGCLLPFPSTLVLCFLHLESFLCLLVYREALQTLFFIFC